MQNKLRFFNDRIDVLCDKMDQETQQKVQQFYPVHFNRSRTLFTISIRKAPEVLAAFRGITDDSILSAPQAIQHAYFSEIQRRRVLDDLRTNGPKKSPVVNSKLTLQTHQQLAREIAEVFNRFCFFYDTRTGKTLLSLSIINDDVQLNPRNKWLIICPLILIENAWLQDAEYLPTLRVLNTHASTRDKRVSLINSANYSVYVTNTESFINYWEYFLQKGFTGCIIDESSDMKSHRSQVGKTIVEFSQQVPRMYLLSGTPAPNGEHEYYRQLQAVDFYGIQQNPTQFKERYFYDKSRNPQFEKLVLMPHMKNELQGILETYAIYVDKEDVINTPGRSFEPVYFDLPEELMARYKKLQYKMYVEIQEEKKQDTKKILASSIAAKLNKLNQLTSGFIIDTKAKKQNKQEGTSLQETYLFDMVRFIKMMDILRSFNNEQCIIWANYHKEFDVIKELLGVNCACVYGETSLEDKNKAIQDFKSGRVQYLVANPASASKGLTLTNTCKAIYFSLTYSYELFKQSSERIYADKSIQPNFCKYYILIANGTIDKDIYSNVLHNKADVSITFLNHIRSCVGYNATDKDS